ncbi:hypothetical protein NM208_g253 [Fusarium decemcellulare]|uniref:Uncharacterized protein n=1 Tax=Fusarium decemcellulare TaxID=57161 RepID=A0ACC1T0G0_9HYPO|nr:hypothetical protein NM208_g253 [Fusarium decemcellulare]
MEVAGLAIGVAAFAGPSISGILTLKSFFNSYKSAADKVKALNNELDSLSSTLIDVEGILNQASKLFNKEETRRSLPQQGEPQVSLCSPISGVPAAECSNFANSSTQLDDGIFPAALLKSLKTRVQRCESDIKEWNTASKGLNIGIWHDFQTFKRKVKVVAKKELFDEITSRVSSHREAIGNCLSSLNLSVSRDNLVLTRGIKSHLNGLTETNLSLLEANQAFQMSLKNSGEGINSIFGFMQGFRGDAEKDHAEQMDCMRSIAHSLSTIASHLTPSSLARSEVQDHPFTQDAPQSPPSSESFGLSSTASSYSCGAVLGIEELLLADNKCFFCNLINPRSDKCSPFLDSLSFGRHLVYGHRFGGCDLSLHYETLAGFKKHLTDFHFAGCKAQGLAIIHSLHPFACHENHSRGAHDTSDASHGMESLPESQPATAGLVEAQISQILKDAKVLPEIDKSTSTPFRHAIEDNWASEPNTRALSIGLEYLQIGVDNGSVRPEALYKVTCLLEEIMVSGLDCTLPIQVQEPLHHETISKFLVEAFSDLVRMPTWSFIEPKNANPQGSLSHFVNGWPHCQSRQNGESSFRYSDEWDSLDIKKTYLLETGISSFWRLAIILNLTLPPQIKSIHATKIFSIFIMPYLHQKLSQMQLDEWASLTVPKSSSSGSAVPSFLADQAVRDILREIAMDQLVDQKSKYFVESCLEIITPKDKEFLALFRWHIESVHLNGKPTIPVLPHIVSPSLRGTLIADLLSCRSWGLVNDEDWNNITNDWSRNANMVFVSLVSIFNVTALIWVSNGFALPFVL